LHRDLKDENIVIDLLTGSTRLIDFGAATMLKKSRYHDFQGTRLYCPPEWFLHSLYLGKEATVWSMGVLLYNMLNGRLPFHNEKDICTAHLLGPLPYFTKLSLEARSLIEKCLCFDPFLRPSLDDVLKHPWLQMPCQSWKQLNTVRNFLPHSPIYVGGESEESDTVIHSSIGVNRRKEDVKRSLMNHQLVEDEDDTSRPESGVGSGSYTVIRDAENSPDFNATGVSQPSSTKAQLIVRRNAKTSLIHAPYPKGESRPLCDSNNKLELGTRSSHAINRISINGCSFDSGTSSALQSPRLLPCDSSYPFAFNV